MYKLVKTFYILITFVEFYNERPNYVQKCQDIISNKYPDKMANILRKHNTTFQGKNQENFDLDTNTDVNYFNEALCKMSKSIFFDHKISYCLNEGIDKSKMKK